MPATPPGIRASEAIRQLEIALDALPDSDEKHVLLHDAHDCEREVARWATHPPSSEAVEAMMRRVLRLHVRAAKLGRGGP